MNSNPFSFYGRIGRLEFGLSCIIIIILLITIRITIRTEFLFKEVLYFLYIPVYWVYFAQGAKRCHDRGNSGWFQLIPFYWFWMLIADSEPGLNDYGPNPKGMKNSVTIIEDTVVVYSQISINATIITELQKGDLINVDFSVEFGDFYKVRLLNGQEGYILKTSKFE